MLRLRGKPLGPGVALGTAAILRAPNGIPLLPARLVALTARASHRTPVEPIDVVLLARDYDTAASLSLPWARVVGIAVESQIVPAEYPSLPVVAGVDRLLSLVSDDDLLLIDGDRGVVLVDPDGTALASYQAERERIAPRRRLYLEYAHQTARTLDGREIHVLARVETLDAVRTAVQNGADALFVPYNAPLLPADASDEEQYEALLTLGQEAGGKMVMLAGDADSISATALLRAATRAEFTLAAPLAAGSSGFIDLQLHLQETRDSLLNEEIDYADFLLAGSICLHETIPDSLSDYLIGRVVVEIDESGSLYDVAAHRWMDSVALEAAGLLIPVEVVLPSADPAMVEMALGLGASGLIVAPDQIQQTKETVRALEVAALRSAIHRVSS